MKNTENHSEKLVQDLIKKLKDNDIQYLDGDGYNTSTEQFDKSTPLSESLWGEFKEVLDIFMKNNFISSNSDIAINDLYAEGDIYFINWYEPETITTLDELVKFTPDTLPAEFEPYVMNVLDWIKVAQENGLDVEKHQPYEIATSINVKDIDDINDLAHPIVDEDPEVIDDKIGAPTFIVSDESGKELKSNLTINGLSEFLKEYVLKRHLMY